MNSKNINSFAAATLGLWLASNLASQGINLPPADLSPGEEYRVLFVTDSKRDATSTDIADYDAFVAADANAVNQLVALRTNWRAVGSTATVDAREHTGTLPSSAGGSAESPPIYLPDGTRIADNYDWLWGTRATPLLAPPQVTASGAVASNQTVWTGTYFNGTKDGDPLGEPFQARLGSANRTGYWIWYNEVLSTKLKPLYGISDVLTVPSDPFEDYGSACGFPLQPSGSSTLGFSYTLRSAPFTSSSPGLGLTFFGVTQQALDLTFLGLSGCQLLTSSEAVVPMQVVTVRPPPLSISHFELTLQVPPQPSLVGQTLYHQGGPH
ncbi:MAG: hypothetical protein AAF628_10390 [Planctomycetota bacterium]